LSTHFGPALSPNLGRASVLFEKALYVKTLREVAFHPSYKTFKGGARPHAYATLRRHKPGELKSRLTALEVKKRWDSPATSNAS